jgi:hypothetical protein
VFPQALVLTLVTALGQTGAPSAPEPPSTPVPSAASKARPHTDLAGTWKYNADESINATTGRPETARAVNDRRGVGRGGGVRGGVPPGGQASNPGGGYGGGYQGPVGGGGFGPGSDIGNALFLEQRDAQRDLMEIAPQLKFDVSSSTVTITDDLDRVLTFQTDGKSKKYQLGAAVFDAKTSWSGAQLRNDMEGPDGLRITATYFLSDDGDRMFLILRVGQPAKDGPPVGVNRVYDRVK